MNPATFGPFAAALCLSLSSGCAGLNGIDEPPRVNLVGLHPVEMNLLEQRYRAKLDFSRSTGVATGKVI